MLSNSAKAPRGLAILTAVAAVLGAGALGPSAALAADPMAWENGLNGEFGVLDLATGTFTDIGNSTGGSEPAGLAEGANGVVYTAYVNGSTLYTVNTTNGALTAVGSGAIEYYDIGSSSAGVFALDKAGDLWSINTSTGASTLLGPTGVPFTGFFGFSAGGSTLYDAQGTSLWSLNTTTGAGTYIGETHVGPAGAAVVEGGVLYAAVESTLQIDTLNPLTGFATAGPYVTGTNQLIFGLAPDIPETPGVPEPAAWALMLIGFGSIGAALRARRKRVAATA